MSLQPSSSSKRLWAAAGLLAAIATGRAVSPLYAGQAPRPLAGLTANQSSPPVADRTAGPVRVANQVSATRGRALFTGAEPLNGRIREHEDALPPAVVACSNCHASGKQPPLAGSDAPVLSADLLMARISRRHGPASAYNEHTFCLVLRTGRDPVSVLLDHVMPLYETSDPQCASLWRALIGETSTNPTG